MLCRFHTFTCALVGSLARGRASEFFVPACARVVPTPFRRTRAEVHPAGDGAVCLRYERRGEEVCDVPRVRNVGA